MHRANTLRALPLARLQARHASSQHTLVFPGKLRKKNNIRKTKNKTKTLLAYLGCRNTLYSHTDCQPEPGSVTREGGACIGAVGVVKQPRRELSSQHRSSSRSAPAGRAHLLPPPSARTTLNGAEDAAIRGRAGSTSTRQALRWILPSPPWTQAAWEVARLADKCRSTCRCNRAAELVSQTGRSK